MKKKWCVYDITCYNFVKTEKANVIKEYTAKEYAIENSTMRCKGDCEKCWINYSILSCEQRKIEDAYLSGAV